MMTEEQVRKRIDSECSRAADARQAGNEGMVRVCARRAAGIAIAHRAGKTGRTPGPNMMANLRNLQQDASLPAEVRAAASRLTATITPQFTSASTQPLEDARIIINHLMK